MQLLRAIMEWFKQMLQVRLTLPLPPHRFSRPAMHKQVGLKRLLPALIDCTQYYSCVRCWSAKRISKTCHPPPPPLTWSLASPSNPPFHNQHALLTPTLPTDLPDPKPPTVPPFFALLTCNKHPLPQDPHPCCTHGLCLMYCATVHVFRA